MVVNTTIARQAYEDNIFDRLCYEIVTELKEKYRHIKRVYVRAEFEYIDDKYMKYLLSDFKRLIFSPQIHKRRGHRLAAFIIEVACMNEKYYKML